jgi:hypothetical protein
MAVAAAAADALDRQVDPPVLDSVKNLRWLYAALALIALAPIWSVHYLPTQDGPSHVYNSWLLRELIGGGRGAIAEAYRIDWRPHPNWMASAVMALLMTVVSPIVAEKLLVTGIVLLFLYGIWLYAGEEGRPYAFLALPFAYNLMLQSGFYNFCIGVGLYFVTVAVWWRRRERTDTRTLALVAVLLLLTYFAHPLPTVLAMGSIVLLGVAARSSPRHLLSFVPVIPLLGWFALTRGGGGAAERLPASELAAYIAKSMVLFTFDQWQTWLGIGLFVLIVVLIATSRPAGPRRSFVLPMLAMLAIYAFAPSSIVGGQMVRERMALFVALVPLAWIAPRWPRRVTAVLTLALSVLSLVYSGYLVRRFRTMDRRMAELVDAARPIGKESTFLPLVTGRAPSGSFVGILAHAVDYAAIERRAVDLDNYEPGTDYFPIANNPDLVAADIYAIEAETAFIDLATVGARAGYVFTWGIGPGSPLWPQLVRDYHLVSTRGAGQVWRASLERAGTHVQRILLPVAGSIGRRGAPGGVWWNVTQSVRNDGDAPAFVHVAGCAGGQCAFELAPHASHPLTSEATFLVAYAGEGDALTFTTVAERTAPDGSTTSMTFPAVRQRDFRTGKTSIAGVPFDDAARPSLRAWTFGNRPPSLKVRVIGPDGRTLGEKAYGIPGDRHTVVPDLRADFPGVRGPVTITLDAGPGQVWGLVSLNDPKVPMPRQYYAR